MCLGLRIVKPHSYRFGAGADFGMGPTQFGVDSSFPMSTLQREHWDGHPIHLGEGFRLHRDRRGRQLEAICHLQTHPLGWELVLTVNASLQRSEVVRSQDAVLDLTERWKAALVERGWR